MPDPSSAGAAGAGSAEAGSFQRAELFSQLAALMAGSTLQGFAQGREGVDNQARAPEQGMGALQSGHRPLAHRSLFISLWIRRPRRGGARFTCPP